MDKNILQETAKKMMTLPKGILAMDESSPTIAKRLASINVENNEINRRRYRELIVTSPDLSKYISGAILFEETFDQKMEDGTLFRDYLNSIGILPGIKVDKGAKDFSCHPNEKITEGLDGLRDRLAKYYEDGAKFCKWRAVITIGKDIPSEGCIESNMNSLARYASLCQENNLVPIVEPEVLMDGSHTIDDSFDITSRTLNMVFDQLDENNVSLQGIVLKPNMILSGYSCSYQASIEEVAEKTVNCLSVHVPSEVPGIAFLSGGQSDEHATLHLNEINKYDADWNLTFSYGRALQQSALKTWSGKTENVTDAQEALIEKAKANSLATVAGL